MSKPKSLNELLAYYALGFSGLILFGGLVGGWGLYSWQRHSDELVRLESMLGELQEVRGTLYRQIKEVFDAAFLSDVDADRQYREYGRQIEARFHSLGGLAESDAERQAVRQVEAAYSRVRKTTDDVMQSPNRGATPERERTFDTDLEGTAFATYEAALVEVDKLLVLERKARRESLGRLARLAPLVLFVPLCLAAALWAWSRRFIKSALIRPVGDLLDATRRIRHGDMDARVEPHGAAELVALGDAVNEMARELEVKRASLLRAEKQSTLAALVPVVAHNIRNPLASIRATAQVMDDPQLHPDVREGLAAIVRTSDRLESWTTALLSYLHPLVPRIEQCLLHELARDVVDLLQTRIVEKSLVVTIEMPPDLSAGIDRELVEQALHGVVLNAIEASAQGHTIILNASRTENGVCIAVSDEGSGMPFLPSQNGLRPGPTTKRMGTGLGIPFASRVCEVHGGTLTFASRPAGGTRVTFELDHPPLNSLADHDPVRRASG